MRSSTVGATALTLGLGGRLLETNIAMYQSSHPVSTSINGMGGDMIDGSGTINPAALNTPGITIPPPLQYSFIQAISLGLSSLLYWRCFREANLSNTRDEGYDHVITRNITKDVTNGGASNFLGSVLPPSSSTTNIAPKSSPRGIKRSRSPELLGDLAVGGGDDGM